MKQEVAKIIEYIKDYDQIALFHHNNIDGDSFSSSYGLALVLKQAFPHKEIKFIANMAEIKANFPMLKVRPEFLGTSIDQNWLAIVGDTSAKNKIDYLAEVEKAGAIVVFDHHQNEIEIKHHYFWHEPNYPASTMQAIEIAQALKINFTEEIAFNLMLGLLTDTNNFVYSLANPVPPLMYSQMLAHISNETMDQFWRAWRLRTMEDVQIKQLLLNNLQFSGQVAYAYLDQAALANCPNANFKKYIHELGNIQGFPIWCLFTAHEEEGQTYVKLHLRSNGPDIAKIAMQHGGGGHKRAAGAKLPFTSETIAQVLKALNQILE